MINKKDLIFESIINQEEISFFYSGKKTIVKPHVLGIHGITLSLHGHRPPVSISDKGWRNYKLSEITGLKSCDGLNFTMRDDYNLSGANYKEVVISICNNDISKTPDSP